MYSLCFSVITIFLGCPGYFGKKGAYFLHLFLWGVFLTVDKKVDHLDDKYRHRWMFIHFWWYLSQNNPQNSDYS